MSAAERERDPVDSLCPHGPGHDESPGLEHYDYYNTSLGEERIVIYDANNPLGWIGASEDAVFEVGGHR